MGISGLRFKEKQLGVVIGLRAKGLAKKQNQILLDRFLIGLILFVMYRPIATLAIIFLFTFYQEPFICHQACS